VKNYHAVITSCWIRIWTGSSTSSSIWWGWMVSNFIL